MNLQIAIRHAKIARDAHNDIMFMKIIAAVTLICLPATSECIGLNLLSFDPFSDGSEPSSVVSRLWWGYLNFAVPLTILTMFGFRVWRRLRETPHQGQ
jgi:purine-cytosine permease-like protein